MVDWAQTITRDLWMNRCMSDSDRRSMSDKIKHRLQWRYMTDFNYPRF